MTDEQRLLAETAAAFMAERAPVSHRRALRDADDPAGFSRDLWRGFAEMGFCGMLVPEADGGLGLGHAEAGLVLAEIGRNLVPTPFLDTGVGAATALAGTRWLPGIAAGDTVVALALDEAARHRPDRVTARATANGNGFRLSGTKRGVPHGHAADLLIVSARDDDGAVRLFAAPAGAARATPVRLLDGGVAADLAFEDVELDGDALLACDPDTLLDAVRCGAAAELAGLGCGAEALTLAYLAERRQFGVAIGSFQALQHRAAHLHGELALGEAAAAKAAELLDRGDAGAAAAVSVAKAVAGDAADLAVREGLQMHGGVGMTDEYDIGLYAKRAMVLQARFGDADYHADRIARLAGY